MGMGDLSNQMRRDRALEGPIRAKVPDAGRASTDSAALTNLSDAMKRLHDESVGHFTDAQKSAADLVTAMRQVGSNVVVNLEHISGRLDILTKLCAYRLLFASPGLWSLA